MDAAKDLNDFRKKEQNDSSRVQPRDDEQKAIDASHRTPADRDKKDNSDQYADTFINVFNKRDIELSPDGEVATVHTVRGFLQAIFDTQQDIITGTYDPESKNDNRVDKGNTRPASTNYVKSNIHKIIIDHDLDFGPVMANGKKQNDPASDDEVTNQEQKDFNFKERHAMDYSTWHYFSLADRTTVGGTWEYIDTEHGHLVIDGQNHNINFASMDLALRTYAAQGDYQEDWQLKNANLFEVDYYGVVSANPGHNAHAANVEQGHVEQKGYSYMRLTYGPNINFTGAQVTWSYPGSDCLQIDIEGKVTAKSVPYYKYNNYIYKTEDTGNRGDQQIFQCYRVLFKTGCKFTGYSVNANCVETSGSPVNVNGISEPSRVTLQDGAQVELHPHGFNGEYMQNETRNAGIAMRDKNSELVLNGSAKLNIICDDAPVYTNGIIDGPETETYLDSAPGSKRDDTNDDDSAQLASGDQLAIHHYPESSKGKQAIQIKSFVPVGLGIWDLSLKFNLRLIWMEIVLNLILNHVLPCKTVIT